MQRDYNQWEKFRMNLIIFILLTILFLVTAIVFYIDFQLRKSTKHLKKHGIPYVGGNLGRVFRYITGSLSTVAMEDEIHKAASATNAPLVGMSDLGGNLNLYIVDLELLKSICVKDFDHFYNRTSSGSGTSNHYWEKMLESLENEQWKGTRTKLSPAFTIGKIRRMFGIFRNSAERMEQYLKDLMEYPRGKSVDVDFLKIFSKYTLDVVASCAFGVESKSFEFKPEERSTFEQMAKDFGLRFNLKGLIKFMVTIASPKLAYTLGIELIDSVSQDYFVGIVKDVMKRRRATGERREDFLQLLMDVREGLLKADEESNRVMNGAIVGDEGKTSLLSSEGQQKVVFEDDHLIANVLLFLNAGYDTTHSTLLFILYSLAVEPEVQEKVFQEVETVLRNNNGELTYEAILKMAYLDMVITESLRCYPPATRIGRVCTKDYTVPGSRFVIKKDSIILIPIYGIHHDARNFPDPDKFIPERFLPENKASRHPYAFMTFGHGPRNCIGMRFALLLVKAALVQLVHAFHFAPCSKTKIPMEFDRNPIVNPKGDMWLKVTSREK